MLILSSTRWLMPLCCSYTVSCFHYMTFFSQLHKTHHGLSDHHIQAQKSILVTIWCLSKRRLTLKLKSHKNKIWSYSFGICSFWYLLILSEVGMGNDETRQTNWLKYFKYLKNFVFNLIFSQLFREYLKPFRAVPLHLLFLKRWEWEEY